MENPEEILHSLEEFSKMKPKDIPRELEEYLCFVAKTGNPVYQWQTIKSLFREKLLSVITEFYESCPSVEIPPCPNVEMFNYDLMKNFILEKLDTFASAPFTVQRICELLTTPRKEYNRIDKYMRALEKNILVVSTTEPGRISTENGDGVMNGIEPEHLPESSNSSHDINVEEMDESPSWHRTSEMISILYMRCKNENRATSLNENTEQQSFSNNDEVKVDDIASTNTTTISEPQRETLQETIISCSPVDDTPQPYVSIASVALNTCAASQETAENETDTSLSITALPASVQETQTNMESAITLENTDIEVDETKETAFNDVEQKKQPEEEEEQVPPITDATPTSPSSSENVSNLIIAEVDKDPEEISMGKEENSVESISPETSSTVAVDVQLPPVQLDAERQQYETEKENLETPKKTEGETETVQTEVHSKDENWPEVKGEPEQLTSVLTSTSSEESKGEPVLEASNSPEQTSELKEAVEAPEVPEEPSSVDVSGTSEQKKEEDAPIKEVDSKTETPMEVEVIDEVKPEEKTEEIREEPSLTSDAL